MSFCNTVYPLPPFILQVGNEVELNSAQEALLRRTTRELQKSLAVVSASSLAQVGFGGTSNKYNTSIFI